MATATRASKPDDFLVCLKMDSSKSPKTGRLSTTDGLRVRLGYEKK